MKKKLLFSVFILLFCLRSFGQAEAYQPNDLIQCNYEVFNLTVQAPIILGNQNPNQFTVNYYLTGSDAESGTNPIANPAQFVAPESIIIFVRVTNTVDNTYAITQFGVSWAVTPQLPQLADVTVCDVYTLPPYEYPNMHYFADAAGTNELFPGNVITTSTIVYVTANSGLCASEGSFNVTITQTPPFPQVFNVTACNNYNLPPLQSFWNYYTGPNGTGIMITPGTEITTSMTLFVHYENAMCWNDESFTVTIVPTPVIAMQPPAVMAICPEEQAILIVDAEGPNLSYLWTKDGLPLMNGNNNLIVVAESGFYQCAISNELQCTSITTGTQVIAGLLPPTVWPPLGNPVCPGNSFSISVEQGVGFTYQWYFNEELIDGATGPVYGKESAVFADSGYYMCVVSGTACSVPVSTGALIQVGGWVTSLGATTSCLDNGNAAFDLTPFVNSPQAPTGLTFIFYETVEDALLNLNPVPTEVPYVISGNYHLLYGRYSSLVSCETLHVLELIAEECTGNIISGTIRLDSDNNGCTANDTPASGIQVMNIHNNDISYAYTNSNGEYTFTNVSTGNNYVSLTGNSGQFNVPVPVSHEYSMAENIIVSDADFCLTAAQPVTDAVTYFYQMGNARPGFPVSYYLYVYNAGTLNLSGNASLTYDPGKLDFTGAIPYETGQIGNTLNFTINDLAPSQYQMFYISFTVKVPPIVNLGDILVFEANMFTFNADANPADNVAMLDQMVVNSYDPNEIVVQQGSQILQTQVPDYLNYTIHFQNTGNAEAINVRLESDLDAKLDWSTFRPVASTHNYTSERVGDHIVFRFDNINLPGSTVDEPGSNGYITYKVKPKATLVLGDIIAADADIYFDFNLPIATNTVTTELVALLNTHHDDFENLEMYPNPARGKVSIRFNEDVNGETTISVFDLQGKSVLVNAGMMQDAETSLDISKLQTGMYFVKIDSGNKTAVKKLVVK
jgi:type IX secretion system substrate protein